MSFGRPPTFSNFSVLPPERGSFPLDHEGECKSVMLSYLNCMKTHKNDNGKCRDLSRKYLECRMDKGLMDRDDMKNLGFQSGAEEEGTVQTGEQAGGSVSEADGTPAQRTGRVISQERV